MKKNSKYIALIIFALMPFSGVAQKITLGSCDVKDGTITGTYQGEMAGGKPHGKGRTVYQNGNIYEGDYVKGKRQGDGVYTFNDGERYEGKWFQGHQHGFGTFYFQNDNKYVGYWYKDYQQDEGTMFYYNGDVVSLKPLGNI